MPRFWSPKTNMAQPQGPDFRTRLQQAAIIMKKHVCRQFFLYGRCKCIMTQGCGFKVGALAVLTCHSCYFNTCACVCACVRACVWVCVCVCVRARVRACVRVWVRYMMSTFAITILKQLFLKSFWTESKKTRDNAKKASRFEGIGSEISSTRFQKLFLWNNLRLKRPNTRWERNRNFRFFWQSFMLKFSCLKEGMIRRALTRPPRLGKGYSCGRAWDWEPQGSGAHPRWKLSC